VPIGAFATLHIVVPESDREGLTVYVTVVVDEGREGRDAREEEREGKFWMIGTLDDAYQYDTSLHQLRNSISDPGGNDMH